MSINNDGWKEDPQKSHSLFYKLYMTGRVWFFNMVLEFIPFYQKVIFPPWCNIIILYKDRTAN